MAYLRLFIDTLLQRSHWKYLPSIASDDYRCNIICGDTTDVHLQAATHLPMIDGSLMFNSQGSIALAKQNVSDYNRYAIAFPTADKANNDTKPAIVIAYIFSDPVTIRQSP